METFRTRTTVSKDGKLSIKNLPFRPGEKVEVIVRAETKKVSPAKRKALIGKMKSLFREIQSLPRAKTITEEEIQAEITAYRKSKHK
jgi:predicted DNA-binding antitoxin AbrB/MazE fold protein